MSSSKTHGPHFQTGKISLNYLLKLFSVGSSQVKPAPADPVPLRNGNPSTQNLAQSDTCFSSAQKTGTFPHDPEGKWGWQAGLGALSHFTEGLFLCLLGMGYKVKHRTLSATTEPNSLCSETVLVWDLLGYLGVYSAL